MRRGQTITLDITSFSDDGAGLGVAEVDGRQVHVAGAAPGDRVRVRVDHVSPNRPAAWASVVEVEARGPLGRKAPCHHAAPTRGAAEGAR